MAGSDPDFVDLLKPGIRGAIERVPPDRLEDYVVDRMARLPIESGKRTEEEVRLCTRQALKEIEANG